MISGQLQHHSGVNRLTTRRLMKVARPAGRGGPRAAAAGSDRASPSATVTGSDSDCPVTAGRSSGDRTAKGAVAVLRPGPRVTDRLG
jgi:hypothetical protein